MSEGARGGELRRSQERRCIPKGEVYPKERRCIPQGEVYPKGGGVSQEGTPPTHWHACRCAVSPQLYAAALDELVLVIYYSYSYRVFCVPVRCASPNRYIVYYFGQFCGFVQG